MLKLKWMPLLAITFVAGCGGANVEQERSALLAVDREWSQSTKDLDKFTSFLAQDASAYIPGAPLVTGSAAFRAAFQEMSSAPGFAVEWTASKAEVSAAGDVGYTTGAYQLTTGAGTERGKYVTIWKKQADGQWKVSEDIFNADAAPAAAAAQHALLPPAKVTWGPAPPSLPPGAKLAVISGDPSQAEPFVIRAQFPAGYTIPAHWHPTTENVTVLSGMLAVGMGERFDKAALQDLAPGGYASLPAEMRHFAMAKAATTIQIHGMGPFAINYVNPADDPSKAKP